MGATGGTGADRGGAGDGEGVGGCEGVGGGEVVGDGDGFGDDRGLGDSCGLVDGRGASRQISAPPRSADLCHSHALYYNHLAGQDITSTHTVLMTSLITISVSH